MDIDDEGIRELALALIKEVDEERRVSPQTHESHHDYIDTLIKKEENRTKFWEAVQKQVYGWGIIVVLSGIGIAVNEWFQHIFHSK